MNKELMGKINYFICRCKDIDWESNIEVFQTKEFYTKKPCVKVHNLEDWQKQRLMKINKLAEEVEMFLYELYEQGE